jgi:LysR family transcriptional regulator, nitrogen assimilation regulatory protein
MDLRQLRYFRVLAAHQHFGRAAAVLHIAQPALSRQIRLLESELGVQLVERHSRGASLTPEGELLLDRANFLLRYVDQIKVDIIDLHGRPRGPVVLGLPPAVASVLVLPLIRVLRERYPEIQLHVVENFTPALGDALEQGTVDVAVLSGPIVASPLTHTEYLLTERICAIGLAGDARLEGESLPIAALRRVPLILTGVRNSGIRLALERAIAKANVELDTVIEVESVTVAVQLVQAGIGWTIHFPAPVQSEIENELLQAVPIDGITLERYLGHSVVRPQSTATAALTTLVLETARSLMLDGRWLMAEARSSEPADDMDPALRRQP